MDQISIDGSDMQNLGEFGRMPEDVYHKQVKIHVSKVNITSNCMLAILKILTGYFSRSSAMIADGVHSFADVFGSVLIIIGAMISSKEADEEHPYGHERLECIISVLLSMILFATAGVIGYRSLYAIFLSQGQTGSAPGILALLVACFTIGFKEILYRYSRTMAERINSVSLRAEAWHHRTDALASVGTLVGIAGSMLGFAILDSVGSGIISLFIFKAACDILRESFDKMIDRACEPEEVRMMENIVGTVIGVKRVDCVKTRIFGSKVMVDVEIETDAGMNVRECYEIAQAVDQQLHRSFGQIKTCTVQVRPYS